MGGNSKQFPQVLALANKELKKMIGYEIVELSTRAEREKDILGVAMETDNEPKKGTSRLKSTHLSLTSDLSFFKAVYFAKYTRSRAHSCSLYTRRRDSDPRRG